MQGFWPDLRYGFRLLCKSPGFTAVAVLTLAVGVGANTAIFSLVNAVLLRPLPYQDPGRLVTLWESNPRLGFEQEKASPANFVDWRSQNTVFEEMAFYPTWGGAQDFNLLGPTGAERIKGAYVSAAFFPLLGVPPALGRTFLPVEDRPEGERVAVLSYELWQRRYGGDPQVLGRTLITDSYRLRDFTVVGVMPSGFRFPDRTELWLPAGWMGVGMERRGAHWFHVLARLKPGVTLEQARTQLDAIQQRIAAQYPGEYIGSQVKIVPLLDQLVGNTRTALLVLLGAVAFVLLIACANVANLLLARAAARQREIAVRTALGAGRARVLRQLLTESLLLALLGGASGTLLAFVGLRLLVAAGAGSIPRSEGIAIDGSVLGFTLAVSLLTGIVFGLVPALQASKVNLNEALKEGGRGAAGGRGRNRVRTLLAMSQVSLALVLLIGAGLMIRSLLRLQEVDLGFDPRQLLTAEIDMSSSSYSGRGVSHAFFEQLVGRVSALPGVQAAGGVWRLPPMDASGSYTLTVENRPPARAGEFAAVKANAVTPDYFRAMGIPLVRGRLFDGRDTREAPPVVVINETLARRDFPGEDAIGRRVAYTGAPDRRGPPDWREVVGIVGDVKSSALGAAPHAEVYAPYWQWPWHAATLVVRTSSDPAGLAAALRGEVQALNKNQPVSNVRTMEQILAREVAPARLRALLLGLLAGVALILAAVGVYGVISYSVSQRTHEIGVRLALGAQPRDIFRLVVGQGLAVALAGVALGLGAAFALTRALGGLLYGVSATDPATFVGVALLLTLVAVLACYVPARRAAKVDPVIALRYE